MARVGKNARDEINYVFHIILHVSNPVLDVCLDNPCVKRCSTTSIAYDIMTQAVLKKKKKTC